MTKRPLITVCVPVYNTASYIRQCIESVLAQEFKDWILLVSDNCSTDGTWEILQEFQHPQIRLFRQSQNIGPNANWNFLLEKVETDYFCFLGSDDYFYPNHLANKVRLLELHPQAPFVHGPADFVDETGKPIPKPPESPLPLTEQSRSVLQGLLAQNYINITSVVFRKASLNALGLKVDRRLRFFGDWHLYVELALFHPYILFDCQTTAVYRIHAMSDARQNIRSFAWAMEAQDHLLASLAEHPGEWKSLGFDTLAESKRLTERRWVLALKQAANGQFGNANQAWRGFRKFHTASDIIKDIPRYIRYRLQLSAAKRRQAL